MTEADTRKRRATTRRAKWDKACKPYFKECVTCSLSCEQIIKYSDTNYNLYNCPKTHKEEPAYYYAWLEGKREYEKQKEEREKHG